MKKIFFLIILYLFLFYIPSQCNNLKSSLNAHIDREALVKRHCVISTFTNPRSPAQVGNGHFAFGMDITGLQTFIAFNTMSDWSWHSFKLPQNVNLSNYKPIYIESYGKQIPYISSNPACKNETSYLSKNPHRFNLGRIGLVLIKGDGTSAGEKDLKNCQQKIDLWTGIVHSSFELDGKPVFVETVCHPQKDLIAVHIISDLLIKGKISIYFNFSYPDTLEFSTYVGTYNNPQGHASKLQDVTAQSACIARTIDNTHYFVNIHWSTPARFERISATSHQFSLKAQKSNHLSFTCQYSPNKESIDTTTEKHIAKLSRESWKKFWLSGAAVDFSGSKDQRWQELERRIVLSQYLMRINECGQYPPQESGLVNNSWYGRFHFEMIWWHGLHYYLWDRPKLFDSYLTVYKKFLPEAHHRAQSEDRSGARWPKCTGDFNREWPCEPHAFILWHEPHPIYFAETEYRLHPNQQTLNKWKKIVIETANYMADNVFYDKKKNKYILGPPLVLVSENTIPFITQNPTFELSYWHYGLRTATKWCKRLGLPINKKWKKVLNNLAPLPIQDNVYVTYEGIKNMWQDFTFEHPALTGVYGMLPGDGVNKKIFKRTLDKVLSKWNLKKIWGWDFPMMAMAAARIGCPKQAIDLLMQDTPNFKFDEHGLATGGPFPYFPSNGSLLTAIAMMCAGWTGSEGTAPGFPKDGTWKVRYENLLPLE